MVTLLWSCNASQYLDIPANSCGLLHCHAVPYTTDGDCANIYCMGMVYLCNFQYTSPQQLCLASTDVSVCRQGLAVGSWWRSTAIRWKHFKTHLWEKLQMKAGHILYLVRFLLNWLKIVPCAAKNIHFSFDNILSRTAPATNETQTLFRYSERSRWMGLNKRNLNLNGHLKCHPDRTEIRGGQLLDYRGPQVQNLTSPKGCI